MEKRKEKLKVTNGKEHQVKKHRGKDERGTNEKESG